jgi:2-polyprenyl-3-methyl-5-hydroxy-6-metoxy-1,4-benzoquinol methylase
MGSSIEILAKEWHIFFKSNPLENKSIINFYDRTQNEIFELMQWHYINSLNGSLQYVFSLDIAQRNSFKDYLDYGSGIGTGGILFAANGFTVTLADVSSQNLKYCRYRFEKRNLRAEFIDIKDSQIKRNGYERI